MTLDPKQILHLGHLVKAGFDTLHTATPAIFDTFMFLKDAQYQIWKEFGTNSHTSERTVIAALEEIWNTESLFKSGSPYTLTQNDVFFVGSNNLLSVCKVDQQTGTSIHISTAP